MQTDPKHIVQAFLTAAQQGDHGRLAALLHPDVHWLQPGNNRFSGKKQSGAEVFQMVGGMAEMAAGTLRLTGMQALAVNGNRVASLVHWQAAQPGGKRLDVDNIDVYTVENGQIVRVEVYSADLTQEDIFWGQ